MKEDDAISRQAALDAFGLSEKTRKYGGDQSGYDTMMLYEIQQTLEDLLPVTPKQSNLVLCKDCKYFEHGEIAEICNRWGLGCVTDSNGWCFLAETTEEQA